MKSRIEPPDWMQAPGTVAVLDALQAAGGEARFVGGCVRDALLGRPVADIDIATTLPPEAVLRALAAARIKAVPTGLAHGTVTALAGGRSFEITTLRVDVETDGRHAVVAYTDDWREDAARRDFTMNALSAAPDGTVYDYFGGAADARAGRVRFIGDPARRIAEDRLRLLRFFRFYAHYGRPPADPAALEACRAAAPELRLLSGERVRTELLKLLAAPDPVPAWRLMIATGTARAAIGEDGAVERLAALAALEPAPDPIRRLAALLTAGGAAAALAERLRLSNAEAERLAVLTDPAFALTGDTDEAALRRLAYRIGREAAVDRVLLGWAAAPDDGRFAALLAAARTWTSPAFPLKGRDVLAEGIAPGPAVGALLAAVEAWWSEGDFRAGRAACLEELRRRTGGYPAGGAERSQAPP